MSDIEKRLRASMRFGVLDGSAEERGILGAQIEEAIWELVRLRARVAELEAALRGVDGIRRCQRCGGEGRVEPPESSLLTRSAECPVCHGRGLVREGSEG